MDIWRSAVKHSTRAEICVSRKGKYVFRH